VDTEGWAVADDAAALGAAAKRSCASCPSGSVSMAWMSPCQTIEQLMLNEIIDVSAYTRFNTSTDSGGGQDATSFVGVSSRTSLVILRSTAGVSTT
jgi:hypothetical protein